MTRRPIIPVLLGLGLLVAACGETSSGDDNDSAAASAAEHHEAHEDHEAPAGTEVAGPEARLALAHDGGITVVRAQDGEVLSAIELPGFNRLNPAGDDRHVMVSTSEGFQVLDLGAWTEAHGDHGHSFTAEPHLTEITFAAQTPGHVVVHADRTVLFDDGTGTITSFDPHHLGEEEVRTATMAVDQAHHGVAVALEDGSMLHTLGNEESRSGVVLLDHRGKEAGRNEQCPGVHGEAFAGDVAVFGCEDGMLLVDDGKFTKVDSPDDYGRIGNLAGSPESPVMLGDYKSNPDAELERPTRVSLVDTRTGELELLDLGSSYSFRSLGRGPAGEALVLGTDGALRIIDAEAGKVVDEVPVVAKWKEPTEWQEPRPTLAVVGDTAWVTEPASNRLHEIDLAERKVVSTLELDVTPNEIVGVTG